MKLKQEFKILMIILMIILLTNGIIPTTYAISNGSSTGDVSDLFSTETEEWDGTIEEVLSTIPDQINIEKTEIEGIRNIEYNVREKVEEILNEKGIQDFDIQVENINNEIHKVRVSVYKKPFSFNAETVGQKVIDVQFSNSQNYKVEYDEYVKNILKNYNSITLYANLNLNEKIGGWSVMLDEAKNEIIKELDDENYVVEYKEGPRNDAGFGIGSGMVVYIYRDGVCYLSRYIWVEKQYKLTIPNYIEDTYEAYKDYINSVINSFLSEEWGEIYIVSERKDEDYPLNMFWLKLLDSEYEEGYIYVDKDNTRILGDISGDGIVDTSDARDILLYCIGKETLTKEQEKAADVNNDGIIDTGDARKILLYCVGQGNI